MDLSDLLYSEESDSRLAKESRRPVRASMLPGRDEGGDDIAWGGTDAMDTLIQGRTLEGSSTTSIRALTDAARSKSALKLPVEAGTRVTFVANLGSVLSYSDIPEPDMGGTVVTVRSAAGDVTAYNDRVHVLWDDGQFRPIMAEHLRRASTTSKRASAVRIKVSSLGDLSDFFEPTFGKTASESDLVHKATKDLWSFRKEGDEYVIQRLFSDDGTPLKV